MTDGLPADVRDTVAEFARKERAAERPERAHQLAERREQLVAEYGYTSRIREDDTGATLVCYPRDWVSDGTVEPAAVDDLSAAVEIPLAGAGDPDDWAAVAERNRAVAERVEREHGPAHGANARAFAAFMSNHRAREIGTATDDDVEEFRTEYYVRNVWPSETERAVVDESIELALSAAADQR